MLLQLLIDMVLHQDVVVAEMQRQQQQQAAEVATAQPHWTNSSSNRDATTPASSPSPFTLADAAGRAAAAAQAGTRRAAGSFSSQAAEGSYVMRLLHNATVEQVQLVEAWGVEDWCSYWRVRRIFTCYTTTCNHNNMGPRQLAITTTCDR